jgi:hypothetical protein
VEDQDHAGKIYLAPLRDEHYASIVQQLSKGLGVDFTMHELRWTLGNRLWRRGKPIGAIAKILQPKTPG